MLDYELCKKLKEAGFPQKNLEMGDIYYDFEFNEADYARVYWAADKVKSYIVCPTLSELIEACGSSFMNLNYAREEGETINDELYSWAAESIENLECWGRNPDEAVANLFLALKS